jgi:hypothetical protein
MSGGESLALVELILIPLYDRNGWLFQYTSASHLPARRVDTWREKSEIAISRQKDHS